MSIQSIDRAIDILYLFNAHQRLDLSEITKTIGSSKTKLYTIGYPPIDQPLFLGGDTKKYQVGFSILKLDLSQLSEQDIYKQAVLLLKKLTNTAYKIYSLGIWDKFVCPLIKTAKYYPLHFCAAIEDHLTHFLPKRETAQNEVTNQLKDRSRQRQIPIYSHSKQQHLLQRVRSE